MLSPIMSYIFALMQFHFALWSIASSCLARRQQGAHMWGFQWGVANLIPAQTLPQHPSLCPHLTPESAYP